MDSDTHRIRSGRLWPFAKLARTVASRFFTMDMPGYISLHM